LSETPRDSSRWGRIVVPSPEQEDDLSDSKGPRSRDYRPEAFEIDQMSWPDEAEKGRLPEGMPAEFEAARTHDEQLEVVRKYCRLKQVASERDIRPDTFYFLRGGKRTYLTRTTETISEDMVSMVSALSGKHVKPLSKDALLELGRRRKLVRLVPKGQATPDAGSSAAAHGPSEAERDAPGAARAPKSYVDSVLDLGAFTFLATAVQQSGLTPGMSERISHVGTREFRRGDYDKAYILIEGCLQQFVARMAERKQKLRREDLRIRAGHIKMTPKELQAKRRRDTEQTQKIERARRRFARVMDGLRILISPR